MAQSLENKLIEVLKRLDQAAEEVRRGQVVTRETETMKVLAELIREQVRHEDTDHSARPIG